MSARNSWYEGIGSMLGALNTQTGAYQAAGNAANP
jgi:hypothetical protein